PPPPGRVAVPAGESVPARAVGTGPSGAGREARSSRRSAPEGHGLRAGGQELDPLRDDLRGPRAGGHPPLHGHAMARAQVGEARPRLRPGRVHREDVRRLAGPRTARGNRAADSPTGSTPEATSPMSAARFTASPPPRRRPLPRLEARLRSVVRAGDARLVPASERLRPASEHRSKRSAGSAGRASACGLIRPLGRSYAAG